MSEGLNNGCSCFLHYLLLGQYLLCYKAVLHSTSIRCLTFFQWLDKIVTCLPCLGKLTSVNLLSALTVDWLKLIGYFPRHGRQATILSIHWKKVRKRIEVPCMYCFVAKQQLISLKFDSASCHNIMICIILALLSLNSYKRFCQFILSSAFK